MIWCCCYNSNVSANLVFIALNDVWNAGHINMYSICTCITNREVNINWGDKWLVPYNQNLHAYRESV